MNELVDAAAAAHPATFYQSPRLVGGQGDRWGFEELGAVAGAEVFVEQMAAPSVVELLRVAIGDWSEHSCGRRTVNGNSTNHPFSGQSASGDAFTINNLQQDGEDGVSIANDSKLTTPRLGSVWTMPMGSRWTGSGPARIAHWGGARSCHSPAASCSQSHHPVLHAVYIYLRDLLNRIAGPNQRSLLCLIFSRFTSRSLLRPINTCIVNTVFSHSTAHGKARRTCTAARGPTSASTLTSGTKAGCTTASSVRCTR